MVVSWQVRKRFMHSSCGVLGQHARPAPTYSSSENISFFSELNRQVHSMHRTEPMHLYRIHA